MRAEDRKIITESVLERHNACIRPEYKKMSIPQMVKRMAIRWERGADRLL